ncbi:MAG: DUF2505 domain-containing protein [Pseudomonadota bacterium]|nr:DUF2505 domain-containing protein [Pseudomonadota bacterium]
MQIRISHHFPVSPREYWEGTRGSDFDEKIASAGEIDVVVVQRRRDGSRTYDELRMSPRKELPALAQRALGTSRFSYVQVVEGDDDTMTTSWKVLSDVIPDKVRCAGTSRVIPAPGGCERIIEGEIKVSIPLLGSAIEKVVLEQLERSYERASEVIRRHLAGA